MQTQDVQGRLSVFCTGVGCPVRQLWLVPLTKHQEVCPKLFTSTEAPVIALRQSLVFPTLLLHLCRPEQRVGLQHKLGFLDRTIPGQKMLLACRQTVHLVAQICLLALHTVKSTTALTSSTTNAVCFAY